MCTCYNQSNLKFSLKFFHMGFFFIIPLSPGPNSRAIVIIHELGLGDKGKRESTG